MTVFEYLNFCIEKDNFQKTRMLKIPSELDILKTVYISEESDRGLCRSQVEADEIKGILNFLKAFLFYVNNPQSLKTIYIRNGKCSHKPVYLAYQSKTNINKND